MEFKNTYYVLRHGESKANIQHIIISSLDDGVKEEYSLTQKGEQQVKDSVTEAKNSNLLNQEVIICSSPFLRCQKTAQIAKEILGSYREIIFDERLKERWFGNLDKTFIENYQQIWDADKENKPSGNDEESPIQVRGRMVAFILELEKEYHGNTFLLVSHGDPLTILQTYFDDLPAYKHGEIKSIEKAEIRKLN